MHFSCSSFTYSFVSKRKICLLPPLIFFRAKQTATPPCLQHSVCLLLHGCVEEWDRGIWNLLEEKKAKRRHCAFDDVQVKSRSNRHDTRYDADCYVAFFCRFARDAMNHYRRAVAVNLDRCIFCSEQPPNFVAHRISGFQTI